MGLLLVTAGDAHNSIFSWVSHLSLQRQRSINPPSPTGHQLVCYWFRWYHHFSRIFVTIGRFIPFLLNHSRNQISEKCHHFFPSISSMDHGFSAKKCINFLWTWPFWSTGARAKTDSAGSSPARSGPWQGWKVWPTSWWISDPKKPPGSIPDEVVLDSALAHFFDLQDESVLTGAVDGAGRSVFSLLS